MATALRNSLESVGASLEIKEGNKNLTTETHVGIPRLTTSTTGTSTTTTTTSTSTLNPSRIIRRKQRLYDKKIDRKHKFEKDYNDDEDDDGDGGKSSGHHGNNNSTNDHLQETRTRFLRSNNERKDYRDSDEEETQKK